MYVATKNLTNFDRATKSPVIYKAGDVIPDFENWDIHAQRSHLNLEWVKKVAEEAPEPKQAKPKKRPSKPK